MAHLKVTSAACEDAGREFPDLLGFPKFEPCIFNELFQFFI